MLLLCGTQIRATLNADLRAVVSDAKFVFVLRARGDEL